MEAQRGTLPTCGSVQCVREVAVHLGYGRVQLKCDDTGWPTGWEVGKVAVHLGYGRVQLKCDVTGWRTREGGSWESRCALRLGRVQLKCNDTGWRTAGEVRKVAVHLQKVLEMMWCPRGLNPFNFIRKHFLHVCLCLSAQRLSERTLLCALSYIYIYIYINEVQLKIRLLQVYNKRHFSVPTGAVDGPETSATSCQPTALGPLRAKTWIL